MWVSWKHQDTVRRPAFEDKVDIFYHRIWGWQLYIANLCLNGGKSHDKSRSLKSIPHSAFAALQIMLPYFETIAKYQAGFHDHGQSAKYFKRGVRSVFPNLAELNEAEVGSCLDTLYQNARCGLCHNSQVQAGIVLQSATFGAMQFDPSSKTLMIDPHQLPAKLMKHLKEYRNRLLAKPSDETLRGHFEDRYAYDNP